MYSCESLNSNGIRLKTVEQNKYLKFLKCGMEEETSLYVRKAKNRCYFVVIDRVLLSSAIGCCGGLNLVLWSHMHERLYNCYAISLVLSFYF